MPPSKAPATPTSRQVVSRQLRALILERGTTAYALGKEAGVDPGVIQRFLNEERDIRLDTLDRLADILGLRLVEGARGRGRPARSSRPTTPPRTSAPTRPARQAGRAEEGTVSGPRSEEPAAPLSDHGSGPTIAQVDHVSGPRPDEATDPAVDHETRPADEWWTTPADAAELRPDDVLETARPITADDPAIAATPGPISFTSVN